MTSDGILERISGDGQEGGDAGRLAAAKDFENPWDLIPRDYSLAARTGTATWWRVGIPSEMGWTNIGIRRCELMPYFSREMLVLKSDDGCEYLHIDRRSEIERLPYVWMSVGDVDDEE